MKTMTKRAFSVIMALVLSLSVFVGIRIPAKAASVDYVYSGNYIYNWGTREEVATFLSPNAIEFYEDNNTSYQQLAALSGSSSESGVPSSALYKKLQSIMSSNQTYTTSYDGTKSLFKYTDCQGSGKVNSGKISSFYSGTLIGPNWGSSPTWNREHTWPNSKGDKAGSGENDIAMLRPTAQSENSSRGNKAYGQSSGYYNPNAEANGKYDLRGDVARIMLYVYVRWNCTNTGSGYNPNGIFGTDGIFESKTVLLNWMQEDPVDTWELGRNDSVESIIGTRNIFVDYPELAFIMFGQSVPKDYQSPSSAGASTEPVVYTVTATSNNSSYGSVSVKDNVITATPVSGYEVSGYTITKGSATVTRNGNIFTVNPTSNVSITINFTKSACTHKNTTAVPATSAGCESVGYTAGVYCNDCRIYISGHVQIAAKGHTYSSDKDTSCNDCGAIREIIVVPSTATISFVDKSYRTSLSTSQQIWEQNGVKVTNNKTSGSANIADYSNPVRFYKGSEVIIEYPNMTKIELTASTDSYASDLAKGTFSSGSVATNNTVVTVTFTSPVNSLKITLSGGQTRLNQITVYSAQEEPEVCEHPNYTIVKKADADCENPGYTGDKVCDNCGEVFEYGNQVAALGHNYKGVVTAPDCENGGYTTYTCSVCNNSYIGNCTDELGHNYKAVVTAPDCENGGYTTYTCSVCNDNYIGNYTDELGHNYKGIVTAPTCTAQGYTTFTCANCGDAYIDGYTDATGNHKMVSGTVVAPTQNKAGYTIYACENCDKTEEKNFVMPFCNEVQNVTATVIDGTKDLKVTWDALDRADLYLVYVYDANGTQIRGASTTLTTVQIDGFAVGEYTVKVRARVGSKYTENDKLVPVTFGVFAPKAELVVANKDSIEVKWSPVADAEKYWVEIIGGGKRLAPSTTDTTIVLDNLIPGTEYTIRICAKYGLYNYTEYGEALVVTTDGKMSVNASAVAGAGGIKITWNSDPMGDMHWIYRVDENGNEIKLLAATSATEAFVDYIEGQNRFKVTSRVLVGGKNQYIDSEMFEYDGQPVKKVGFEITSANDNGEITTLNWQTYPDADMYWVYRFVDGEKILLAATSSTTVTVATVAGQGEFVITARIMADGKYQYITSDAFVAVLQ